MKHTPRRAACAATLVVLGTLLARAEPVRDTAPAAEPPAVEAPVRSELERVLVAESIVRSERSAILLGELLASESADEGASR
ncbi:MAG TPA: hypothetical protein ENJ09_14210 [Planctomycetes bacterium]|nr:hypothetical protein [Planctomycetota bacterium]